MERFYKDLIDKIRRGRAVLWVGAGFSTYAGYPSGKELISILKDRLPEEDSDINNELTTLQQVAQRIADVDETKIHLHSYIKEIFGASPRSIEYHEYIKENPYFKTIITTNFDLMFERVYPGEDITIIRPSDLSELQNRTRVTLYKIHGDIAEVKDLVLTEDDYAAQFSMRENFFWVIIRSIILTSPVVFLGYSLKDQYVKDIFQKIKEAFPDRNPDYFFIGSRKDETEVRSFGRKYNIKYIRGNHEIVKTILDDVLPFIESDFDDDRLSKMDIIPRIHKIGERWTTEIDGTKQTRPLVKTWKSIEPIIQIQDDSKHEVYDPSILTKEKSHELHLSNESYQHDEKLESITANHFIIPNCTLINISTGSFLTGLMIKGNRGKKSIGIYNDVISIKGISSKKGVLDSWRISINRRADVFRAKRTYDFLNELDGPCYLLFQYKNESNRLYFDKISVGKEDKEFMFWRDFYSDLIFIMKEFGFLINNIKKIEEKDINAIGQVINLIKQREQKLDSISGSMVLDESISNKDAILRLSEKNSVIRMTSQNSTVRLFGQIYKLPTLYILGKNVELVNGEKTISQINEGLHDIEFEYRSNSDELYLSLDNFPNEKS